MKRFAMVMGAWMCAAVAFAEVTFSVEALPKEWLVGQAPQAWAKDEVYVLECWASWCGPCVRAMPHVENLWQALKDEGIHIIGVNVSDRLKNDQIVAFLQKQPVPPTYPIVVDRANRLRQTLKFQGIPYACAVRNGVVVWTGHPGSLTAERLRSLRDNRPYNPANEPPPPDPMAPVYALEAQADQAAAAGQWEEAIRLQSQAVAAHPYQAYTTPYIPKLEPEEVRCLPLEGADVTSSSGDLAPYAELVGKALPADETLLVIELWQHPWQVERITQQTQRFLPGKLVEAALPTQYRLLTVVDRQNERKLRQWAKTTAAPLPELTFASGDWEALFGYTSRLNYPFVAVFRKGVLLYRGAIEVMPVRQLLDAKTDPKTLQQALLAEAEREKANVKRALDLMKGKIKPENLEAYLEAEPLDDRTQALILPLLFAPYREAEDAVGAAACFERLTVRHHRDEVTLTALQKIPETWPDLAALVHADQSLIASWLAELNRRGYPDWTAAELMVAAREARSAGQKKRFTGLVRDAIRATASAKRLQRFLRHEPAWPSR